jgi:hypothetical protein
MPFQKFDFPQNLNHNKLFEIADDRKCQNAISLITIIHDFEALPFTLKNSFHFLFITFIQFQHFLYLIGEWKIIEKCLVLLVIKPQSRYSITV